MKDFNFKTPVNVLFGKDILYKLNDIIEGENILLVYGGSSLKRNGTYEKLMNILNNHFNIYDFGGHKEIDIHTINEGITLCKKHNITTVIGIGGAVVMDMSKVIAFGSKHEHLEDYILGLKDVHNDEKLKTILIPTYPSSGSEMDGISDINGISDEKHGSLHGVYSDYTLLDPTLTYSLDKRNTAFSALVTFIQASVYYFSNNNPIAKGFGEIILKNVLESYYKLLKNPQDYKARGTIMWAASLTTMSVTDIGLDDPYVWSVYDVGLFPRELFNVGYREGVTLMYPQWLKYTAINHFDDIKAFMVNILDIDETLDNNELIEAGCIKFKELMTLGDLPTSMSYYGSLPNDESLYSIIENNKIEGFDKETLYKIIYENFNN